MGRGGRKDEEDYKEKKEIAGGTENLFRGT